MVPQGQLVYLCSRCIHLAILVHDIQVATLKFRFIHVPLSVFGFVRKQMDPLNNTQDGRRLRRERERFLAASMTDEQREEKNRKRREITITDEQREEKKRKRREAYKRKKCQSHNKENDPGLIMIELTIKVLVSI